MDTTGALHQDECAAATNWGQTSSRRLGDAAVISDLRSFATRIERLKDQQDAIGEDIRGIYKEVVEAGYDKTVLGRAILERRRRAKATDPAKLDEQDKLLSVYLAAIEGKVEPEPRTRSRMRENEANPPRRPAPGSDGQGARYAARGRSRRHR